MAIACQELSLQRMSEENIKGTIVCRLRDTDGEIIVVDDGNVRSLYFGDRILQSSIRLDRPDMLIEDYSQAMMTALLFMNNPGSVLVIGLGGCSLINFLLKAFPQCAIDIVEIRRSVIDLARKFFLLPGEHAHLKIFHDAGQDFICRCNDSGGYDLVLIDAFDEDGPAAHLLKKDFIAACRARLNRSGVFVMNVWNRPSDNFPALYASVREIFEGHTLKLPLGEAYQNVLILGFGDTSLKLDVLEYRSMAERLQLEHRINFPKFLRYLHWQNSQEQ